MPAAPTASKAGKTSTRKPLQKTSAKGAGANTVATAVLNYCEEDAKKETELLRKQLRGWSQFQPVNVEHVLHWSNYSAKTVAQIQARGMPIDMLLWNLVQENKAAVIRELVRKFDPSQGSDDPIYTPEGEWSYVRFERWLASVGVTAWPRLESGQLDINGDAFRLMYHVPGIEGLHALRDSLGVIVRAKLPIGRDGRNRPSLFPFCTATGRNAHAKSCSTHMPACDRSWSFRPTKSASISTGARRRSVLPPRLWRQALIDDYRGGDVYHALAYDVRTDRRPRR